MQDVFSTGASEQIYFCSKWKCAPANVNGLTLKGVYRQFVHQPRAITKKLFLDVLRALDFRFFCINVLG